MPTRQPMPPPRRPGDPPMPPMPPAVETLASMRQPDDPGIDQLSARARMWEELFWTAKRRLDGWRLAALAMAALWFWTLVDLWWLA